MLEVTDQHGNVDVDFAIVKVADRNAPEADIPGIHPVYFPTEGIQAGDPVLFKVRARRTTEGVDVWDFGDASPKVTVRSNVDTSSHAADGYASTVHRFRKAGRYIVAVQRKTSTGNATGHLLVHVE